MASGPPRGRRVAIIGGGFAGSAAAAELAGAGFDVVVFDQGRRGPGGRASHRRVAVPVPVPVPAPAAHTPGVDNDAAHTLGVDHVPHGVSQARVLARPAVEVGVPRTDRLLPGRYPATRHTWPSSPPAPLPDDGEPPAGNQACLEFDHGAQFFRCETDAFRAVVAEWSRKQWCAEWTGKFAGAGADPDFFGFPHNGPFFTGVGGNHLLPRRILAEADVDVRRGTRVLGVEHVPAGGAGGGDGGGGGEGGGEGASPGQWEVRGVGGEAAFHDTAEDVATKAEPRVMGRFDAVLVTDISAAFHGWHRASAGLPPDFAENVRRRARVPLFACMVAFEAPLQLGVDAVSFGGNDTLWFAARTRSKPGYDEPPGLPECWTLVSTPGFAFNEITTTSMQDQATGAFRPQEDGYLNTGPAPTMLRAFQAYAQGECKQARRRASASGKGAGATASDGDGDVVQVSAASDGDGDVVQVSAASDGDGDVVQVSAASDGDGDSPAGFPKHVYLQGQRWGSGFPAPAFCQGRDEHGCGPTTKAASGVNYETATPKLNAALCMRPEGARASEGAASADYVADDGRRLYYAGDYCSSHTPGVEAAVLSAIGAAQHIKASFG